MTKEYKTELTIFGLIALLLVFLAFLSAKPSSPVISMKSKLPKSILVCDTPDNTNCELYMFCNKSYDYCEDLDGTPVDMGLSL